MKYYTTLISCFILCFCSAQQSATVNTFDVYEESVKIYDYTHNEWKEWTDWKVKQFKIIKSDALIHLENNIGNLKILKLRENKIDKDGDEIWEFSAVDKDNERCDVTLLRLNKKPGKYQLYIRYRMLNIVYNMKIE